MASKKLFAFNAGTMPKEDVPGLQNSESADDFVFDDELDDVGDDGFYEFEDYEVPMGHETVPSNTLGLTLGIGHDNPDHQAHLAEALPMIEERFAPEDRRQVSEDVEQLGDWYKCNRDSGRPIYVKQEWLENAGYAGEGISDEEMVENLRGSIRGYEALKDHEFADVQNGLSENRHVTTAKDFYMYDCMYQYDPDHGLPDAGMDNVHKNLNIFAQNGLQNVDELSPEARFALEGRGKENAEVLNDSVFHMTDYDKIVFSDEHIPIPDFGPKQGSEPLGIKKDAVTPQEQIESPADDKSGSVENKHEDRVQQANNLLDRIGLNVGKSAQKSGLEF